MVSQTPIASKVKVRLLRQKKELEVEVLVSELPKRLAEAPSSSDEESENHEDSSALAGLVVRELTPVLAGRFGLDESEKGVVIVKTDPNSKAYEAGIRPGDIILQINQKNIPTLEAYKKATEAIRSKDRILLLVRRKGEDLFVTLKPE
jgi:serine protease Do